MPVILAVAAAALTLASCNKEQELLPSTSSAASVAGTLAKPDLLVAGSWHQTGLTVSAPIEGSSPVATSDMFVVARPGMLVRMVPSRPMAAPRSYAVPALASSWPSQPLAPST